MYKRLLLIFLICFLLSVGVGSFVSYFLFRHYQIEPWNPHLLIVLPVLILLTFIGLLFRFWRWHYFLRRSDIRIPTRLSLSIYLSAFSLTVIPLFIGEIALKTILIRRHSGTPLSKIILIVVYERLLDLITLAILTVPYLIGHQYRNPILSSFLSYFPIVIAVLLIVPYFRKTLWIILSKVLENIIKWLVPDHHVASLEFPTSITSWRITATAMAFSLSSWLIVASILPVVTTFFGGQISWLQGIGIFGISTMVGGISLSPGSVGVTGFAIAQTLIQNRVSPSMAGLAAFTTRLSTFGLVFMLGVLVLGIYLYRYRYSKSTQAKDVFRDYEKQFAPDARDYYIEKKIKITKKILPILQGEDTLQHVQRDTLQHQQIVLDLGCGPGWYLPMLADNATDVIGIDTSVSQLQMAKGNAPEATLVGGDICTLPYRNNSINIAYGINIFHHLPDKKSQQKAFQEIHRVLKPDGRLILHEMNPTSPWFRFYLGYILPLFNRIDRGVEIWIYPKQLEQPQLFELEKVDYFTFLPDFIPRRIIKMMTGLEDVLEKSLLKRYSAHYMAILKKVRTNQ
jgi:uncharacterized protein (TIRG00374 family)